MIVLALLAAAAAGLGVMLLFVGVGSIIEPRQEVKERLDILAPAPRPKTEDEAGPISMRTRLARALGRISIGRSFAASAATELARANLALTVGEYMVFHLASAAVLSLILLLTSQQPLFAMMGAAVGLLLPRVYVRQRQAKRFVAFQEQLPDILTLLVGSLRSGYGITIAMDTVAKQMPPPASEEFARVVREIGLGVPITQALANLVRRVHSDDLDLVATAITIQYEVGGNLAAILETISDTIRARVRLKGQLRALTAQQSLQRYILTALPLVMGGIIYILNPAYLRSFLLPGPWLVIPVAAAVLVVVGYVVMGKLSHIEL